MKSKKRKGCHCEYQQPQSDTSMFSIWMPMFMMFLLKPWNYGEQTGTDEHNDK